MRPEARPLGGIAPPAAPGEVRSLLANLDPGHIELAPGPARGLVNLPEHAWIAGATVSSRKVWQLADTSQPLHHYYVSVTLLDTAWDWGDGCDDSWPDDGEAGYDGDNPTHVYNAISARMGIREAAGQAPRYLIQASERYSLDIRSVWSVAGQVYQQDWGDLGLDLDRSPTPAPLAVGQIQGVTTA